MDNQLLMKLLELILNSNSQTSQAAEQDSNSNIVNQTYINKICVIRSYDAGVFIGKVKFIEKDIDKLTVILDDCRRIWCWNGAASLSQLSIEGCKAEGSKITVITQQHLVKNIIEIMIASQACISKINSIPFWECANND